MASVVGVRFKQACRMYYFDAAGLELHVGEWVVVESARGQAMAQVVLVPDGVPQDATAQPLKPVLRRATQEDVERASDIQQIEMEALRKSAEMVREMNLPMKVFSAECDLEANHLTLFFRSEERVDFRDLVKRLSALLKMRIELRQMGPRDAAKTIGGLGRCGRPLCCASFLTELNPVSIKMAKEQNLPLNPTKISGVCGRLLCCLSYEVSTYRDAKKKMPETGRVVETSCGPAKVVSSNPLAETVLVETESQATVEVPLCDIKAAKAEEPRPPEERQPVAARPEGQRKRRRSRKKKKKAPLEAMAAQSGREPVAAGTPPAPPAPPAGGQLT